MSTSKHIDKICIVAVCLTLILAIMFMYGGSFGITPTVSAMEYESTLFDNSYVHSIDIVMDGWDSFIENCENEEYGTCNLTVDGNQYNNVAIRAKGNTSLSNVKSLGSQRYSFKIEFDHYENGNSCDGLDKLCLNNLIQDNTMMKDYLVYQMMNDFGVDSPLCSFAYITVNGEDWGLYLAVEGIEDSFLSRNYGSDTGELYKPDSMGFGGGRGNGKDFKMDEVDFGENMTPPDLTPPDVNPPEDSQQMSEEKMPQGDMSQRFEDKTPPGDVPQRPQDGEQRGNIGKGGMPGGKGSDDVKLKYIDDDSDSYSNIFNNAKTDITAADKKRLISALKNLSEYADLESTVDIDEVIRYFVVHNFVVNGDSYTGNMIHNYYLHESDGRLGMIPWDYNLAFGTFRGNNASDAINSSIDNPVSGGSMDDRPMIGWIFSDEKYIAQYHEMFTEFVQSWLTGGRLTAMIEQTAEMLLPYVEKDPTKFCTSDEFEAGVKAISKFVTLRTEAVILQLNGDDTAVDAGDLNLSDMGTMNHGREGGNNERFQRNGLINRPNKSHKFDRMVL